MTPFSIVVLSLASYSAIANAIPQPRSVQEATPAPPSGPIIEPSAYNPLEAASAGRSASKNDTPSCAGVTLCTGPDQSGDCFWGCYPDTTMIYLTQYWTERVESARLDVLGSWCQFYAMNFCYLSIEWPTQLVRYPGANFGQDVVDDMGCFTCSLTSI